MTRFNRQAPAGTAIGLVVYAAASALLLFASVARADGDAGQLSKSKAEKAFPAAQLYSPYAGRGDDPAGARLHLADLVHAREVGRGS